MSDIDIEKQIEEMERENRVLRQEIEQVEKETDEYKQLQALQAEHQDELAKQAKYEAKLAKREAEQQAELAMLRHTVRQAHQKRELDRLCSGCFGCLSKNFPSATSQSEPRRVC